MRRCASAAARSRDVLSVAQRSEKLSPHYTHVEVEHFVHHHGEQYLTRKVLLGEHRRQPIHHDFPPLHDKVLRGVWNRDHAKHKGQDRICQVDLAGRRTGCVERPRVAHPRHAG